MSDLWKQICLSDGATVLFTKCDADGMRDEGPSGHKVLYQNYGSKGPSLCRSILCDSILFDGVHDYVTESDSADFDVTSSWSIEWSMYHIQNAIGTSYLFHFGTDTSLNHCHIYVNNAGGSNASLIVSIRNSVSSASVKETDPGSVSHSLIDHWCISYSSGVITVYKNGSSLSLNDPFISILDATVFNVGRYENASTPNYFRGRLGNIAIYKNVALTSSQVLSHFYATR